MPALKHFRKYKIHEDDVERVVKHLKLHKKITANDVVTRPLPKPRRKGKEKVYNEPIPWVKAGLLMGSWQHKDLKSGPSGKLVLYGKEDDIWKLIVPLEQVEQFMRSEFLSADSRMGFSRDNAYYHLSKKTLGISRRHAYSFLEKQGVLQVSRNIPVERRKGGMKLDKRGYCEMDLIIGQGRDVNSHLKSYLNDWVWLSLIDNLTGYGVVGLVTNNRGSASKEPRFVAKVLRSLLDRLEKKLGAKVHTIAADHGREFFTDVKRLMRSRGIRLKQVNRGSRVEAYNQTFQRTFHRLVRLGRGTFSSCQEQAEEICNNLRHKHTKVTPEEAVKERDEDLADRYNKGRESQKAYKGQEPKVGDRCRVLVKARKNIRPMLTVRGQARLYKAYHGRHFAPGVHKITKILKRGSDDPALWRYYTHGAWHDRDEILLVSGVDAETERLVADRKRK